MARIRRYADQARPDPNDAPGVGGDLRGEFMNNAEPDNSQPLGLDIGSSRIVVARKTDKKYQYETQLNAFVILPFSKLTESLLLQENVFHEAQGQRIIVAGNDAEKFAQIFHVETRRPMLNGVLNPQEPDGLGVVRRLITKMVGHAATEGQKIFFSVPAPSDDGEGTIAYHEASFRQILTDLGYQATSMHEGLAVVFGELGTANYTGIGISCGSGLCNVCLAVLSLPVISFSVPKAGDFIDTRAAMAIGLLATRMRALKENSFQLNGLAGDQAQNALTVYYDEMIGALVDALRNHISSARRLPKLDQKIPLVLSGGTAMPRGFLDRFEKSLRASEFPLQLSDIRVSADPLYSTARGALMAALC
jgi:hypothetical protein